MIEENTKTQESATASLSECAVACKHWRWMPGMSSQFGIIVERDALGLGEADWVGGGKLEADDINDDALPDLDDPATIGCLLALVREAWGPTCSVVHVLDGNGWALITSGGALGLPELGKGYPTRFHRTYAEGIVAALEAAP